MSDDERFLAAADAFQTGMARFASMVSGAVKEFVDQGWPEEQARMMVFAAVVSSLGQVPKGKQ